MKDIQSTYGGQNITEPQLEDVFRSHLPVDSASCNARLTSFFTQWFDTPYPVTTPPFNPSVNKPQLTGPGLNGPGFTCASVSPASPNGSNGWYTSPVSLTWSGFPTVQASQTATKNGCVDETVSTDGTYDRSCGVTVTTTATGAVVGNSGLVSETFKLDQADPVVTFTGARTYTVDETVAVHCAASDPDPGSGVASDTCPADIAGPAYTFALGDHPLSATATDVAGNQGSGSAKFTIVVTFASLKNLVTLFSTSADVTSGLNDKLDAASKAKNPARTNNLNAFANQVRAQTGKALTADQAAVLLRLADALK
jgi:hypothetical protein